ncbi:uncharacterized protein N7479_001441 [Penicillium vulpinum]|uniref:DUF3669 domain-containing protein n=1 Tax=Penicillium vulpinum TaxID=29845 RepID=A0A1V6RUI4_9EURO|nr:uncharacterized protein N7479_001441 [Penicillium vulpinum]KAJ5971523.1 hypothetical protein N7479_001441 [Penicillium vulpinum]OQE05248.1 hypothetical protein PENVUL_c026G06292 [Penicillium vulpinum]
MNRRNQVSSDESGGSTIPPTLLTNQLSALFDSLRNEELELESHLIYTEPREVLSRILSPSSMVSTSPSLTLFNASQKTASVGFRSIGFGQCGIVFERPGRAYVVKIARPSFEDALWEDFQAHFAVYQAFTNQQSVEVRVPRIFSYVPKTNSKWWDGHLDLFPQSKLPFPLPTMALITERIFPLPKLARKALIDVYCPTPLQAAVMSHDTNRDCLARIYLGRRRGVNELPPPNFTLRNFNLCLDQMIELNLPIQHYARAIGQTLAIMHWSANVDCYDVEFVLGSEGERTYTQDISRSLGLSIEQVTKMPPHTDLESMIRAKFERRTTRIWVLDFNLCNIWNEQRGLERPDELINHLVGSFFENDPYYPRPSLELEPEKSLWLTFSSSYHDTAVSLLSVPEKDPRLALLPAKFLDACIFRQSQYPA